MSRSRTTGGRFGVALGVVLFVFATLASGGHGQDRFSVLRIQALEGEATLERVYAAVYPATLNEVLAEGDRLKTMAGGRVELSLGNGLFIRLDEQTFIEVGAVDGTGEEGRLLLRLFYGSLYIDTQAAQTARFGVPAQVRLDTPDGAIWVEAGALLRVDVDPESGTYIRVLFGRAEVLHPQGQLTVFAGQALYGMRPDVLPAPLPETTAYRDAFDQWNEYRRSYYTVYAGDATYLPPELRYDGVELYRYGTWRRHPDYGYVWLPPVQGAWFPYYQGYWAWVGDWIWIPFEPWGWVTHHYGFWTFDTAWGWAWVPHTRFRFAWVTWYDAGGYLGWCPLTVGFRPLTLIHIEFNRIYQYFPVSYVDPHGRPWIFVRRDLRPATPVLRYRVKEVDPGVLARGRIRDHLAETPWTLGWVSAERLRARGYQIRDGRLLRPNRPRAIRKVRPSARDLETLRSLRTRIERDRRVRPRLRIHPAPDAAPAAPSGPNRTLHTQPGPRVQRPATPSGRTRLDTRPAVRNKTDRPARGPSRSRALRTRPGPDLRRPSGTTGPDTRTRRERRWPRTLRSKPLPGAHPSEAPEREPHGISPAFRLRRRTPDRTLKQDRNHRLEPPRARPGTRPRPGTRSERRAESPVRSFMKGLQRMVRPAPAKPATPSWKRAPRAPSGPSLRPAQRSRSVRPSVRPTPRSARRAPGSHRPVRKKKN